MGDNPTNRRSSRRKTEQEQAEGIHSVPKDLVEIERNMLESLLIHLKHWVKMNTETVRKFIFGAALFIVLIFLFVFVHSGIVETQNREFYSLASQYHEIENGPEELHEREFAQLKEQATKLCETFWSTKHSNNACLIAGLVELKIGDNEEAVSILEEYRSNLSSDALAAYFTFFNGYLFESAGKYQEAQELYNELSEQLDAIEDADIGLFHKARSLYHAGNYQEAKIIFLKIAQEPQGPYTSKARNYLSLISMQEEGRTKGE